MTSFAEQVAAFRTKAVKRIDLCYRASAQDLAAEMVEPVERGGHMPVKTGFLRSSQMASTSAMPPIDPGLKPPKDDAALTFGDNLGAVNLVIAGATLEDTIYIGFGAEYGPRVNYGFVGTDSLGRTYGQWGANFVGLAVQNWPQIVDENAKKAIQALP